MDLESLNIYMKWFSPESYSFRHKSIQGASLVKGLTVTIYRGHRSGSKKHIVDGSNVINNRDRGCSINLAHGHN